MDIISYEQTEYYNYSYKFDFNHDKLSFCRTLKDRLGWQYFCFNDGVWRSKDLEPMIAIKKRYPSIKLDDVVALEMSMVFEEEHKKIKELEKIPEYKIEIPDLKATLRDYQKNTVGFFMNNGGRGLMCLDPGCGKTVCSLAYALSSNKKKVLVICPNSMKGTWADETTKFTGLKPFIFKCSSPK